MIYVKIGPWLNSNHWPLEPRATALPTEPPQPLPPPNFFFRILAEIRPSKAFVQLNLIFKNGLTTNSQESSLATFCDTKSFWFGFPPVWPDWAIWWPIFCSSWCYKTFFGGNLDFPKLRYSKKFVLLHEPAQKCENNAIFKQKYTLKLLIAL